MLELIMFESREGISYTIVNPKNVLQTEVKILLHAKHGQWADQNHYRLAPGGALGHDLCDGCVVTVYQDPLALELLLSDSQSHGDGVQVSPFDAHEPVLEAGIWELALTPVSLEVAAEAHITGISEELTVCTGKPVRLIQKTDPIPCRQIAQPLIDVPMKFLIQLDSVVEVPSFHGCFDHTMEEGSTGPANMAYKVKFAYQGQNGALGGWSMAHNVFE